MIIDYLQREASADVEADLCIVGAGPAGIAIARAFIGSPWRICVIESGGLHGEEGPQSLYEGTSVGTLGFDPATSRMRVFGGSCTLWGGGCIPMGTLDLAPRDWVPDSGWPLTYAELEPHYARARAFCRLESNAFAEGSFLAPPRRTPMRFDDRTLVHQLFARSPVLFGQAYRAELEQAPNIRVLLHANLMGLDATACGSSVREARIRSFGGREGVVRARHYVLACGGIENARLLLLSDSVDARGLGNRHDLVGRYFMDHPSGRLGTLHMDAPTRLTRPYARADGTPAAASIPEICLSPGAVRDHRTLSGRVRPFAIEGAVPHGIRALRQLRSALRTPAADAEGIAVEKRLTRALKHSEPHNDAGADGAGVARLAFRVGLNIGDVARAAARKLARKPAVGANHVDLVGYFEQAPNRDSRVTLADQRDALGQRKVCIDWRLTPLDRHTYRTAARLFGDEIARSCGGRFEPEPWVRDEDAAPRVGGTAHHLGTTRMSDDPGRGVVDRDCRVHGIDNLYIAGSSVFPTGGWAFPTFTIVALSLRLADTLRARLMELSCLVA